MGNPITELLFWYYGGGRRPQEQKPQEVAEVDPRDPRAAPGYDGADSLNFDPNNPFFKSTLGAIEGAQKLYGRPNFRPAPWRKDPGRLADFEDRRSPAWTQELSPMELKRRFDRAQIEKEMEVERFLRNELNRRSAMGDPDVDAFWRGRANGGDVDFDSLPGFFGGGDTDGGAGFGSESFSTDSGVAGGFGTDSSEGTASVGGEGPGGDSAAVAAAEAAVADAIGSVSANASDSDGEDDGSVSGQVGTPSMIGTIGPDVIADPVGPVVGNDTPDAVALGIAESLLGPAQGPGLLGDSETESEDDGPAPAPTSPSPSVAPGIAGTVGTASMMGGPTATATIGSGPNAFSMQTDTLAPENTDDDDNNAPVMGPEVFGPPAPAYGMGPYGVGTSDDSEASVGMSVADANAQAMGFANAEAMNAAAQAAIAAAENDTSPEQGFSVTAPQAIDNMAQVSPTAAAVANALGVNTSTVNAMMGVSSPTSPNVATSAPQAFNMMATDTVTAPGFSVTQATMNPNVNEAPFAPQDVLDMAITLAMDEANQSTSVTGNPAVDAMMGFAPYGLVDVAFNSDNPGQPGAGPGGAGQAGVGGGQDSAAAQAAEAAAAQAAAAAAAQDAQQDADAGAGRGHGTGAMGGPSQAGVGNGPDSAAADAAAAQAAAAAAAQDAQQDADNGAGRGVAVGPAVSTVQTIDVGPHQNAPVVGPEPFSFPTVEEFVTNEPVLGPDVLGPPNPNAPVMGPEVFTVDPPDPEDPESPIPSPRTIEMPAPIQPAPYTVTPEAPRAPSPTQTALEAFTSGLGKIGLGSPMSPEAMAAAGIIGAGPGTMGGTAAWPSFGGDDPNSDDNQPPPPGTLPGGFEPDPSTGFVGIPLPIHGFPNYPPWPEQPVPYAGGGFVEHNGPRAPIMELPPEPPWTFSPELRMQGGPEESFPTPGGYQGRDFTNRGEPAVEFGARATWRGNWPDWPWGSKKR